MDADVEYKRKKISELERVIKEKEEAERHAKLVKVQMIMELERTKGKVAAEKKRAEVGVVQVGTRLTHGFERRLVSNS